MAATPPGSPQRQQADARARAAARRAFVRQNHPDVGGDPHVFHAGLRVFDGPVVAPAPPPLLDRLARFAGRRVNLLKEAFVEGYRED